MGGVGVFQRIGTGQFEGAVECAQDAFQLRNPSFAIAGLIGCRDIAPVLMEDFLRLSKSR